MSIRDGEELAESNPQMRRSIPLMPLLGARAQKAKGDETEFEAQTKGSIMSYMRGRRYGGLQGPDAGSAPEQTPAADQDGLGQVPLQAPLVAESSIRPKTEQTEQEVEMPIKAYGLDGRYGMML